jgi:DNA topoisomerase I
MRILVIVESPAKCKSIAAYLNGLKDGHTYTVLASVGHVRDLDKKALSIDVEGGTFAATYVPLAEKAETIEKLAAAVRAHDHVLLATDQDREGEGIAWHLQQLLGLKARGYDRITFNEITAAGLAQAVAAPRKLDGALVAAQETRRVLDRLVGYKLSPLLWKRFDTRGALKLSAGRVQSATMRMIVDREREVEAHASTPYWSVAGDFLVAGGVALEPGARLVRLAAGGKQQGGGAGGSKSDDEDDDAGEGTASGTKAAGGVVKLDALDDARALLQGLQNRWRIVPPAALKTQREKPPPPFTTSTLQQEASAKLGMPIKLTMGLAQQLYERGHITYMRTDSTNLSEQALKAIDKQITASWGADQVTRRTFAGKKAKGAQEAHEAVRPTRMDVRALAVSGGSGDKALTRQHAQLYDLIWKRTVATQMLDAVYQELQVQIADGSFGMPPRMAFKGRVRSLVEPGYLRAYGQEDGGAAGSSKKKGAATAAAALHAKLQAAGDGVDVACAQVTCHNTWTSPPARYTESTLIKALEKAGVGRPSTYVSILGKLYDKQYLLKQNLPGTEVDTTHLTWTPPPASGRGSRGAGAVTADVARTFVHAETSKLVPTETGLHIDGFLRAHFPQIVDVGFTSSMEEQLDSIAQGETTEAAVLGSFWKLFEQLLAAYAAALGAGPKKKGGKKKGGASGGAGGDAAAEAPKIPKIPLAQAQLTFDGLRPGKSYVVRLARYGPVVQCEDQYWGLKSYLSSTRKGYMDMTEDDVRFVTGFPYALAGGVAELHLGPYGVYMKKDGEGYRIPTPIMKAYGYKMEGLVGLTGAEVKAIVQAKKEYLKKKEAAAAAEEEADAGKKKAVSRKAASAPRRTQKGKS